MRQVEAIINWELALVFERLKISNRLILEQGYSRSGDFCAIAYIGVQDESYHFRTAKSYLDLFVLTCALTIDVSSTYGNFMGIEISDLSKLGEKRVTAFEKVNLLWDYMQHPRIEPILLVKERFCELLDDRQQILDSYLGLALRYYYYAIQSYFRKPKRMDEMILDLTIVAETLFSTGTNFKRNLKHRLSNFITGDEDQKLIIAKNIGYFYEYRSAIVHGIRKKKKITVNDIATVKNYIQKALDKALSKRLFQKDELIEYIESDSS